MSPREQKTCELTGALQTLCCVFGPMKPNVVLTANTQMTRTVMRPSCPEHTSTGLVPTIVHTVVPCARFTDAVWKGGVAALHTSHARVRPPQLPSSQGSHLSSQEGEHRTGRYVEGEGDHVHVTFTTASPLLTVPLSVIPGPECDSVSSQACLSGDAP